MLKGEAVLNLTLMFLQMVDATGEKDDYSSIYLEKYQDMAFFTGWIHSAVWRHAGG